MRKYVFVITVLILIVCSYSLSFAAPLIDFSVSGGISKHSPSGTFNYDGDLLDLRETLDLGNSTGTALKLKLEHPVPIVPNFYFHYIPSSFEGEKRSTTSIDYGGSTFDINTIVKTNLEINRNDLGIFYNIPLIKTATTGILDIEFGINARFLNFMGELQGTVSGLSDSEDKSLSIVIPMVYAGIHISPIKKVTVSTELKWLDVGGNSMVDYEVELRIKPISFLSISAGYFSEKIKIDSDDLKTDIKISGPYGMIGIEF